MTPTSSFLDALRLAAEQAERAEEQFRREIAERVKLLDRERAFAHRRLNFMRTISEAIAATESEEIAVAAGLAVARWSNDSEARTKSCHFSSVIRELFASLTPDRGEGSSPADMARALDEFEMWYRSTHSDAFWIHSALHTGDAPCRFLTSLHAILNSGLRVNSQKTGRSPR